MVKQEKRIVINDREILASTIEREARSVAAWMLGKGIGENDAVGILAWNDALYFSMAEACAFVGARLIPISWHLTKPEVEYILADSGAKALFGHSQLIGAAGVQSNDGFFVVTMTPEPYIGGLFPKFSGQPENAGNWIDWDDVLASPPCVGIARGIRSGGMFYTSGTTGNPKGVIRSAPSDEVARAARLRSAKGVGLHQARPGQAAIVCCPLYHSGPFANAMMSWSAGLDIVVMPRFDAREFLTLSLQHRIAFAHLVPTMFIRLLDLPEVERNAFDASSFVAIAHGAAPCSIPLKQRMLEWWGPVIREYYAATETGVVIASTSEQWTAHPGTIGRTVEGSDARVVDESGMELGPGESGRLIVRTESTPYLRYHGRYGSPFVEGWDGYIWLGDIGYIDVDGFVFLTDRSVDIIISGGTNIYPAEIELELVKLAGVADCGVFGVPTADIGEGVIALVECAPGANLSENDIIESLGRRLAHYKIPKRVIFVEKMPREESGKLRKRILKREYVHILRPKVEAQRSE